MQERKQDTKNGKDIDCVIDSVAVLPENEVNKDAVSLKDKFPNKV